MTSFEGTPANEGDHSYSKAVPADIQSVENLLSKEDSALTDDDLRSICKHALVMTQKMCKWEAKFAEIDDELMALRSQVESHEQYSKNYDLLLHNFPDVPTDKYNYAFSKWAVSSINEHLPSLEPKLRISDIDTSHAFKTRKATTNPMAIVRFCSRDTK